jgi:hypothetical protein
MTFSKAELLEKLRTTGEEAANRLRAIPLESFEQGRYESGWNGRQILAHIASIEWSYPRLVDVARQALSPSPAEPAEVRRTTPEEAKGIPTRTASGGINDYNERQVEKRAQMSVGELIAEFETNRATTIAAFEQADDALFGITIRSAGGITGSLADVVNAIAVLHVGGHINDIAGSQV